MSWSRSFKLCRSHDERGSGNEGSSHGESGGGVELSFGERHRIVFASKAVERAKLLLAGFFEFLAASFAFVKGWLYSIPVNFMLELGFIDPGAFIGDL